MPRNVKTRRQGKADTLRKNAAKQQTSHPGKQSANLESEVIIDENLAKQINRLSLVSPSKEVEEVTVTSSESEKTKATHQRGKLPKGTRDAWELGNALDKDEEQYSSSDSIDTMDEDELLDHIWKDLEEIFPSSDEEIAKGDLTSKFDCEKRSANQCNQSKKMDETITSSDMLVKEKADHQRGTPEETCNASAIEQYNTHSSNIVDKAELDQILKDLNEIFPPSEGTGAQGGTILKKQSCNVNRASFTSLKEKAEDKTITSSDKLLKKKAAYQRGTPEGNRKARELENTFDKNEEQYNTGSSSTTQKAELYQLFKDPNEMVGDSGPVPPKFFGNSGYFMLTGTNSQLAQQVKNLAAKNIFVESFVELPNAIADIVEQQMTELVQNRDPILGMVRDKYDLLEPRRVPRQRKLRKCPIKTK